MTVQPSPVGTRRPPQDVRSVALMIVVSAVSVLVTLVALPGYLESPLAGWLGPAVMLLNLGGLVGSLVLLPRVLYRAPVGPIWAPDEKREQRAVVYALVIIALAAVSDGAATAAGVALVSIAARRRWPAIALTVAAFGVAYAAGRGLIVPLGAAAPTVAQEAIGVAVLVAILVLFGLYRGSRRELWRSLQQEADLARREQAARVMQAREAERTRIAGEMHDSLSHRLALISLHAGALEYRADLDPAVAREAAGVIRAAAETAVEELHEVLAVLRPPEAGTAPAPTLADVRTLADTVRATGHPVDLTLDVGPGEPGTATTGHLYRVLQESFTNAVKHAPGLPITATIAGGPAGGISVSVRNPVPLAPVDAPGSRMGLAGLTERMALIGGRFQARVVSGEFLVEAWLPWA